MPSHPASSSTCTPSATALAAALCVLSLADPSLAQTAAATGDGTQGADTQTITVTATRRREPVRDVPLAVSAIDTDALVAAGAKDLADYIVTQPGINLSRGGRANSIVTIRGVATSGQSSATVGIYVDDVPVGSAHAFGDSVSAFDQRLLDLSTIEILRGPQGTLYGASSMGGLMKYVTAQPDTRKFAGSAGAQVTHTSGGGTGMTVNGVLNAPLSAGVAGLRVSAFYDREGGYVDATGPAGGTDINKGNASGARVALGLQPTREFSARFSAQTQTVKADGQSYIDWDFANRRPKAGDLERVDLRVAEPQKTTNTLLTATLEYDLGFARVSSITGKQTGKTNSTGDFSIIYSIFVPTITRSYSNIRPVTEKTTQEFRIVSQTRGAFDWLAGLYYGKETTELGQDIFQATAAQPDFRLNPLIFGPNAGFFADYKEYAVYGTGTLNVSDALAITFGARASKNDLDVLQRDGGVFASNKDSGGSSSDKPVTYLLAARYKINPTSSAYLRAASGYRPGGPNLAVLSVTGQPVSQQPTYQSDSLWSYEAGYKAALPRGLGTVDLSVYEIDWSDIQVIGFLAGGNFRTNAGKARIRGVDLATTLQATKDLSLTLALTHLDAKLAEASPIGAQTARAGSRLPYSARLSANASARYDFSLSGNPAFASLSVSRVGDRNTQFDGITSAPNYRLPAFTQVDLSGGVEIGAVKLGAFVRNLTDTRGLLNMDTSQTNFGGSTRASIIRPRTVGVSVALAF